jgi:isocitrate/isopropylmalate dehydrogenase
MMLRHLNLEEDANRISSAVYATLADGSVSIIGEKKELKYGSS